MPRDLRPLPPTKADVLAAGEARWPNATVTLKREGGRWQLRAWNADGTGSGRMADTLAGLLAKLKRGRPRTVDRAEVKRLLARGMTPVQIEALLVCSADLVRKIQRGER